MAQVWLTYEELAELMRCEPSRVRRGVIENAWPRRKSHDGLTRIKLPPDTAHEYMVGYAARFTQLDKTDEMVAALRGVLDREAEREGLSVRGTVASTGLGRTV